MADDAKKTRAAELLAIRDIMATEGGRQFMWRNLEISGIFTDNFDENPFNHARNSGHRAHGIWLQSELMEAAQGSYLTMIKENTNG